MSEIRKPAEETIGLYPGLVVCDNRVSGSITIGPSRLPLWAIPVSFAMNEGWDYAEKDYGVSENDLAEFAHELFNARGDLGRLVLLIAESERRETKNRRWLGGVRQRARLKAQLKRCIDCLDDDPDSA